MANIYEREGVIMSPEDAKEYDRLMELSNYHDRLQYIFKIKLNSLKIRKGLYLVIDR